MNKKNVTWIKTWNEMKDVTWQAWYIKVQYTIAQKCNSSNEHGDIVSAIASSRDLEKKDHLTNLRIDVVSFNCV